MVAAGKGLIINFGSVSWWEGSGGVPAAPITSAPSIGVADRSLEEAAG